MKTQGEGIRTVLNEIKRPDLKGSTIIAHSSEFYNPLNPVTIYQLADGSYASCALHNGWLEYWYKGDYRTETANWPLSMSQYYEF